MSPSSTHSEALDGGFRDFIGKWKLVESNNFGAYMRALGIGFIVRQAVRHSKAKLLIAVTPDGHWWTITSKGTFKTWTAQFREDTETDFESIDGRKVRGMLHLTENNVLILREMATRPGDHSTTVTCRILDDGKLQTVWTCEDVTATRIYKKSAET